MSRRRLTDTILLGINIYNSGNYGKIKFKLKDILDNEKMSKNKLIVILKIL